MIERVAHAKINLALHVTGCRDDGYHLLDTLVVFTAFGDRIDVLPAAPGAADISLKITGPFASGLSAGSSNLVFRAAQALWVAVEGTGHRPVPVEIRLVKNLPVASGIGGGSADAAAALLALQRMWGSEVALNAIAGRLGADVAMCLQSSPLRARGTGEVITPLGLSNPLALLLVNPGVELSTPRVFGALEDRHQSPICKREFTAMPDTQAIAGLRNDLEAPAITLAPVIRDVLEELRSSDPLLARMSGSGATCFGIFETVEQAELARRRVAQARPDWWCIATSAMVS